MNSPPTLVSLLLTRFSLFISSLNFNSNSNFSLPLLPYVSISKHRLDSIDFYGSNGLLTAVDIKIIIHNTTKQCWNQMSAFFKQNGFEIVTEEQCSRPGPGYSHQLDPVLDCWNMAFPRVRVQREKKTHYLFRYFLPNWYFTLETSYSFTWNFSEMGNNVAE